MHALAYIAIGWAVCQIVGGIVFKLGIMRRDRQWREVGGTVFGSYIPPTDATPKPTPPPMPVKQ